MKIGKIIAGLSLFTVLNFSWAQETQEAKDEQTFSGQISFANEHAGFISERELQESQENISKADIIKAYHDLYGEYPPEDYFNDEKFDNFFGDSTSMKKSTSITNNFSASAIPQANNSRYSDYDEEFAKNLYEYIDELEELLDTLDFEIKFLKEGHSVSDLDYNTIDEYLDDVNETSETYIELASIIENEDLSAYQVNYKREIKPLIKELKEQVKTLNKMLNKKSDKKPSKKSDKKPTLPEPKKDKDKKNEPKPVTPPKPKKDDTKPTKPLIPKVDKNKNDEKKPEKKPETPAKVEKVEKVEKKQTPTVSGNRDKFIKCARTYLGTPYLYGGTSRKGIDCSGFVYCSAKDAGLGTLPRTAKTMYGITTRINTNDRKPGDLVFFAAGSSITHVGIYIGDNQMIHSASDGSKTGVIISSLSENYWKNHYYASGKFIK